MKKIYKVIVAFVLAVSLVCVFALAACGNNDEDSSGSGYTVTFIISDTESETQTVEAGGTAEVPEDPERDGYLFTGWYADSAYTTDFDFTAEITSNTTVYAGWTEHDSDHYYVTYHWNYEGAGVYKVASISKEPGRLGSFESPTREGYRLMGWYYDADCTQQASTGYLTEDIDLYALWYYGYVMEAEYTDLTDQYEEDRVFFQYSNNLSGTGAILTDDTCSNGKFVCSGSQPDKYLLFEVYSDVAVDNAYMTISASMNYGYGYADNNTYPDDGDSLGTVCVSSEMCKITVFSGNDVSDENAAKTYTGGTALSYDTMSFDVSVITEILGHCAFKTYIIGNISLSAGTNYIKILVTSDALRNSGTGQTTAKSINVDCLTIYSSDASNLKQEIYQQ